MNVSVGPNTIKFLRRYGFDDNLIENFTPDTRVVQDIGLDGDSLEEFISIMQDEYGIDMDNFEISNYGHKEKYLLTYWWPINIIQRFFMKCNTNLSKSVEIKYITLEMIEKTLLSGVRQF